MLLNCSVGEDSGNSLGLQESNQSLLKEINPEYSLEGLMLKPELQCCVHLMHLEGKQSTLLSSQVATGISWSPLSVLKGVKPPVKFGERTRDCSPGQAGKDVPNVGGVFAMP